MARIFNMQIARSIRGSLGRFLAILLIVALGCGFYAGLRMTGPDMRLLADAWYDGTNLFDLQVVSSLGFTQQQVDKLAAVDGVEAAMPARSVDVMTELNDSQYVMRIHTLNADAAQASRAVSDSTVEAPDPTYLNRLVLDSGAWPTQAGEAVLSADRVMNSTVNLGDTVRVEYGATDLDDVLVTREYRIVGLAHSSLYASDTSMGSTSLGSGHIQQYMYVAPSSFDEDYPFTEVYLRVAGAAEELASSDAYQQRVDAVAAAIDTGALAADRLAQLKDEAQAELDDARAEYDQAEADANRELGDAKVKLDDAKAEIDSSQARLNDAWAQIADGQRQLDEGAEKLESGAAEAASAERDWNKQRAQLEDAIKKAQEGKALAEEGLATAEAGKAQAEQGIAQIDAGLDQIATQQADLQAKKDAAQAGIDEANAQADAAIAQMDAQIAELEEKGGADPSPDIQAQIEALRMQIAQVDAQRAATVAQIEAQMAPIDEGLQQLAAKEAELQAQRVEAQAGLEEAEAGIAQAQAGIAQADDGIAQATAGIQKGDAAIADAKQQVESGRAQLAQQQGTLESARAEAADGEGKLAQGRQEYEDGLAEYESKRADAERELADARTELDDAQREIDELEAPEIYVLDRTKNVGARSVQADSERIDNIASVFPFVFFLVAALVALTTMTRMVDEERQLIGTFKGLGYSKRRITGKYLLYAGIASTLGAALGIAVLGQVLPVVVQNAYAIMYNVPPSAGLLPYDLGLTLLSAVLGVGITLFATWVAAARTLHETPAALMLPPAPVAGKRILLERVGPLWRRLSFSWKVTCRNLFRYKKRFWMTVIGLAGCTALLLTGFGLHNAIWDIIDGQYGPIVRYNVQVVMEDDATDEDAREVERIVRETGAADAVAWAQSVNLQVGTGGFEDDTRSVTAVAARSGEDFAQVMNLRARITQEPITLAAGGAVLTEKLASLLGVKPGDELSLFEQDSAGNPTGAAHRVRVDGVAEYYVGDALFMDQEAFCAAMGLDVRCNSLYADTSVDVRADLNDQLMNAPGVRTVAFNDETIDTFRTMLQSVNIIVVVLVAAAALLSFIVLYNLININITERRREIASLKVLGFTARETNSYIFREVLLLAIIGAVIGLVLGVFLEGFVVTTAEVDYVMFGRVIHAWSYGAALILTLIFTCVVMLFMRGKLAVIDMVESLKSVE